MSGRDVKQDEILAAYQRVVVDPKQSEEVRRAAAVMLRAFLNPKEPAP